jgi:hypothetical protein
MEEIMILEFSVSNYRSFKEKQTLSFEPTSDTTNEEYYCHQLTPKIKLLKFAILYGSNASGKTNILRALSFLRHIAIKPREMEDETGFEPFAFDEETTKKPGEFEIFFFHNKIKHHYLVKLSRFQIKEEILEYYPSGQPVEVYHRNLGNIKFGTHKTVKLEKKFKDALETNTVNSMTLLSALQVTNIKSEVLYNVFDWFKKQMLPIIRHNTRLDIWTMNKIEENINCKNLIVDLLQNADFNINDLEIKEQTIKVDDNLRKYISDDANIPEKVKNDILAEETLKSRELLFMHDIINEEKQNLIPLNFDKESEGTKRFFGLGGPLNEIISNDRILLIDEIERSLHPDLINYYINTFLANSPASQLIITSHSLDFMSDPDEVRRDVIWFTEKNEAGATELYSLADFKSTDIRKGMDYLKAYKAGKFGAKPNIGSIFLKKD